MNRKHFENQGSSKSVHKMSKCVFVHESLNRVLWEKSFTEGGNSDLESLKKVIKLKIVKILTLMSVYLCYNQECGDSSRLKTSHAHIFIISR